MKVELFFNYYLYAERIDRCNYSLCKLRFVDSILHINLLEILISIDDMIRIEDMIYSYLVFGGYNVGLTCNFNSNFINYEFVLKRNVEDDKDILLINELKGNTRITRITFPFGDDSESQSIYNTIYDLFEFLYESFLYDKIPLADLAPDFDNE